MRKFGALIISHGSRDGVWVEQVREACAQAQPPAGYENLPVECAFLELVAGSLIQDGIDRLEAAGVTDIVAVPLFISSGSTHIDEIAWALGVKEHPELPTDLERFRRQAAIRFCPPIDDDAGIARLVTDKLKPLSRDPAGELVLVVGHGSKEKGFHARWRRTLMSLAGQVRELGGYAEADCAMLLPDQLACRIKSWRRKRPDLRIVVAPLFLGEGYFTRQVIPKRLSGFDCAYSGEALLPGPEISRWIERRLNEALPSHQNGTGDA